MKPETFKKKFKLCIIILLIVIVVVIPISIINYSEEDAKIKVNECTKKGNTCTTEEMISGVEVLVEVKDGTKYLFNVISNDENQMTLMLNKNLTKEVEWQFEGINLKGPASAQYEVQKTTAKWENIKIIENYKYLDGGRLNYELICQSNHPTTSYDCSTEIYPTRGYDSMTIIKGISRLHSNLPSEIGSAKKTTTVLSTFIARARLITQEEILALSTEEGLPQWMVSNLDEKEGYWTLTSSTSRRVEYAAGAIAIAKSEGKTTLEMLYTLPELEPNFKIGVRPVITIDKK